MPRDEGWDQPDVRHQWILKNGHCIKIKIIRNFIDDPDYEDDDEDGFANFDVYWQILENGKEVFKLPKNRHEEDAVRIAMILYPELEETMELVD